jgi:nitroreductase
MALDLTPDQLLTTTRSVRKRLDLERPVERAVIEECIEIALQAPTGGNRQGWHWVVVTDPDLKAAIANHYGRNYDPYAEMQRSGRSFPDGDPRAESALKVSESATYLRNHLHEVPAMVIPCLWGRLPADAPSWAHAGFWASIHPAAWSFMLALRARGLGSAWTSLHLPSEREVAELLGIPYDQCAQAGLFPVAYTIGTDFKPASRLPLDSVLHWDTW